MEDPRVKELRIKTGVLKRVVKEKQSYEVELQNERKRLQRMSNEGRDTYDLNKQNEVIKETEAMLPECESRIHNAYNDLKNLLQEADPDIYELAEFSDAKEALELVVV